MKYLTAAAVFVVGELVGLIIFFRPEVGD